MAASCREGEAVPSWIAKFLHSLPHVNFDFDNISATFAPTDADYQQSLVLYSSVPALFGALVCFLFFVHFVVFCAEACCKKPARRRTQTKYLGCIAFSTCLSALIFSGSIIATFVFNDEVDEGVTTVTKAIENINNTLKDAQTQASSIQNTMVDVRQDVVFLKSLPHIPIIGLVELGKIEAYTITIIDTLGNIKQTSLPNSINMYITDGEYYRWWGTFGILGLQTLTCLVVVYSVMRRNRCGLEFLTLLGTLALLVDWTLTGVILAVSIAMSDLCFDPRKTVNFYLQNTQPTVKCIVNYYIECKRRSTHPYSQYLDNAVRGLSDASQIVQWLIKQTWIPPIEAQLLNSKFLSTKRSLDKIGADLNCSSVKQQYVDAHCAVCYPIVGGLSQMLLMTMALGLVLVIILCFVTPFYHKIGTHKKSPRHSAFEMCAGADTPYHSVSNEEEDAPLVANAPPPTYESCTTTDFQFHSCQEERNIDVTSPPQQQITANPRIPPPRGTHESRGEITNMAF